MSKALTIQVERDLSVAIASLGRVACAIAAFEPTADNVPEAKKLVALAAATAKLAAAVEGAKELHCKSGELIVESTAKLAAAERLERAARPKGRPEKVAPRATIPARQKEAESRRAPLARPDGLTERERRKYYDACHKAETPPTVSGAVALARLAPARRKEALAKLADDPDIRRAIGAARRTERVEKLVEISAGNADLSLPQRYPLVYADPPWRYEHVKTESRAIENQYPTMDLDEICALPVAANTTEDAILFLWATSPKLAEAMRVIEAWEFTYRTNMVWVKDKIGMGYYARQRHELLLIATRGEMPVPPPSARPDSVIEAPRTKHSAKPAAFAEVIERMYPELPKLEMFCRSPRDGWAAWGNQA